MDPRAKRIIRLMIIAVLVLAAALTATAEFTRSYRAKRVISATASDGMLFSSNHLRPGTELTYSTLYIDRGDAEDEAQTSFDLTVTVCNFAQGNPTRYYRRAIDYTLTSSVVRLITDGGGSVTTQAVAGSTHDIRLDGAALRASYNETVAAGAANTNSYVLSLPKTMLTGEKLYVLLTATPVGSTYTDLAPISALIDLAIKPEASATSWHLEGTDDRTNDVDDYAGYNFRLSGSGRGTVVLGWDSGVLTLSEVFRDLVNAAPAASVPSGWTGLTAVEFDVDAAAVNSYDIQFYPCATDAVSSWSDVAAQIVFTESTETAEP